MNMKGFFEQCQVAGAALLFSVMTATPSQAADGAQTLQKVVCRMYKYVNNDTMMYIGLIAVLFGVLELMFGGNHGPVMKILAYVGITAGIIAILPELFSVTCA